MSDDDQPHEIEINLAAFREFADQIIAEMDVNVIGASLL